jgi:hypothetical protein
MSKGYGLADEMEASDKRQAKWEKQREKRGFDDTELWNLDSTLGKFMAPRLRAFRKQLHGHPGGLTEKQWDSYLVEMIYAFDWLRKGRQMCDTDERAEKGLDLFRKYLLNLWD